MATTKPTHMVLGRLELHCKGYFTRNLFRNQLILVYKKYNGLFVVLKKSLPSGQKVFRLESSFLSGNLTEASHSLSYEWLIF